MISKAMWGYAAVVVWGICTSQSKAAVVTFEGLLASPETAYVGEDGMGGFSSEGAGFSNSYTAEWGTWDGFAYSNQTDTTTADYTNDTSAYAGGGADGSSSYGVGYVGYSTLPTVTYASAIDMTGQSVWVTNTTYAYLSMANGDLFAKQFGGASGDDADYFLLTITGYLEGVAVSSVEFYLADYRFDDNSLDYIIDDWTEVDLSELGTVDELQFSLTSSDVGEFGMNTPAYFAIDNLATVPEPSAFLISLSSLGLILRRRRH
ncbi:DUF4465 domain-containing protein [Luteolibacter pohnpeiensis]|uniref:DUF4465 domain-containing protein n=1 Tax=Luteolibacter pohnpeiensis TaxID=454153 RepID=A0A934S8T0_9BACT|nr:DUF4465 domain-containing protein [Luteolibacter pohnpeiensis]MBK1881469.1 DUF4465 domain-containing protein [Luteolibacter pohnpeiensis]